MIEQPVIETLRLQLRPLEVSDSFEIQKAAGNREIADTMISLPHPYPEGEAERYIPLLPSSLRRKWEKSFVD